MPIVWDIEKRKYYPVNRRHWRDICGKEGLELMKSVLVGWDKVAVRYKQNWNLYTETLPTEVWETWKKLLNVCNTEGWYCPRVINDELVFTGSKLPMSDRDEGPRTTWRPATERPRQRTGTYSSMSDIVEQEGWQS